MQQLLGPYLKGLYIKKYQIPNDIFEIFNENESIATHKIQVNLQKINGKFVPNNCLSMYYNSKNAFNMATEYADKNGFEYDTYMNFRSDIMNFTFPENIDVEFFVVSSCDDWHSSTYFYILTIWVVVKSFQF